MVALWIPSPLDNYYYSRKSPKVNMAKCTNRRVILVIRLCKMTARPGAELQRVKVLK